jgi:Arc/MetJ-type ribon-helix-helix transcriptional regulator
MKRITFVVPDDLAVLLEDERRRRDVSVAEVIREALTAHLAGGAEPRRLPFIGLGRSGFHDTARNIDRVLDEEWDAGRGR